jgi:sugar lactone lactonase YvrE
MPRHVRRRALTAVTLTAIVSLAWAVPASAARVSGRIALPDGFQPEGIHVEPDGTFYAGSLADGTIVVGDVKTGETSVLMTPTGHISVGLEEHRGLLYVAGGPTGAFVVDAATGEVVQTYDIGAGGFVNDVVVTGDAAWFTNSFAAEVYRVSLSGGMPATDAETLELTGDFELQEGFNLNGIEASPNGRWLVVVQSNTGELFRIDPSSGATAQIDLGGASLASGDGLLMQGHRLYVGRNPNVVDVVRLRAGLRSGRVVDEITSPDFEVTTTLGRQGGTLYVIQARFGITPTPDTPYWIAVVAG